MPFSAEEEGQGKPAVYLNCNHALCENEPEFSPIEIGVFTWLKKYYDIVTVGTTYVQNPDKKCLDALVGGKIKKSNKRGKDRQLSCKNSFAAKTEVLMSDGTRKRIEDIKIGDNVLADDPGTGQGGAKKVIALHRSRDTDLANVTIPTADSHATIHATQHHPWDATSKTWDDAADLHPADSLRTLCGEHVRVVQVRAFAGSQLSRRVSDLSNWFTVMMTLPTMSTAAFIVHQILPLDTSHLACRKPPPPPRGHRRSWPTRPQTSTRPWIGAASDGVLHLILDGKIFDSDRCRIETTSVKGEPVDAWGGTGTLLQKAPLPESIMLRKRQRGKFADGMGSLVVLDSSQADQDSEYPVPVWNPGVVDRESMERLGVVLDSSLSPCVGESCSPLAIIYLKLAFDRKVEASPDCSGEASTLLGWEMASLRASLADHQAWCSIM
ncbi:Hint domain-containing homing endonuclease [Nonomuraea sp. NPDC052129]|uniref:Hint domain-containing homing endonuclease n=1 Tax=Nonomuraea sp. NPDC052129 TaxID=3154651 RepID=UPI003445B49E